MGTSLLLRTVFVNLIASIGIGVLIFLLSSLFMKREESIFWAICDAWGVGVFLFIRPKMKVGDKLMAAGIFDFIMPASIIYFSYTIENQDYVIAIIRFIFLLIFFVGNGAAFRILFGFGSRHDRL